MCIIYFGTLDNTFSFYIGCSDWHHSGEDNELQVVWAKAGSKLVFLPLLMPPSG